MKGAPTATKHVRQFPPGHRAQIHILVGTKTAGALRSAGLETTLWGVGVVFERDAHFAFKE